MCFTNGKTLCLRMKNALRCIDGIYMKNVVCTSADAIYELKGNAKLPARNVVIEDVHVNEVRDFVEKDR